MALPVTEMSEYVTDRWDLGYEAGLDCRREYVAEFHQRANQPVRTKPTVPPTDEVRLRLQLIAEEFCELLDACGYGAELVSDAIDNALEYRPVPVDIPAVADALADLTYVIEGTNLAFGLPSVELFDEVHASNLTKDFSNVPAGGKVRKGADYVPPDITKVLREAGWDPE